MRNLVFIALCASSIAACAGQLLNATQRAVIERRRAVSRKVIEVDGERYTVVEYRRGAKPDGVVTNKCISIVGRKQENPIENALENLRTHYAAATNALATARAQRDEIVTWAEERRDAAHLQTTKAIWQAVIDRLAQEGDD